MRYFIFSDTHVGAKGVNCAEVYSVFKNMKDDDVVIMAGDWVEGWTKNYKDVFIKYPKLLQLMLRRMKHYVSGNHDSFMKWLSYMKIDTSCVQIYYPYAILEVDDKKWYIEHGHLCGRYGKLFKFLDRFDKTKIFNYIVMWIVKLPCLSMANKSYKVKSDMKEDAVRRGLEHGADIVIVGHDHLPAVEKIDGVWLIDPGTAINNFTYVIYENGKFRLMKSDDIL